MCLFVCCDDLQSKYIAECLDEIKQELKQDNLVVKANAVNKLTYVSTHLFHQQVLSTLRLLVSFTVAYYCVIIPGLLITLPSGGHSAVRS